MHFDVSLYEQRLSSATISNRLTVLSFAYKAAGFLDPCLDFRIRRALQGWTKCQPRSGDMRLTLSPLVLLQLLADLPVV